ncbi:MAG TPA: FHA domain-containing protein [Bacteriovoracaceae bacterium]|nr:FHA domain-containing protein [Bacteriovoracaceae bacterium]
MKFSILIVDENFTHSDSNDIVRIGRSDENDCVVSNKELSRFHCVVELQREVYFITDLGSKNGITINGARINPNEKVQLSSDMEVWLAGKFPISFKKDQPTQEFTTTTATTGFDKLANKGRPVKKKTYQGVPGVPKKQVVNDNKKLIPYLVVTAVLIILMFFLGR